MRLCVNEVAASPDAFKYYGSGGDGAEKGTHSSNRDCRLLGMGMKGYRSNGPDFPRVKCSRWPEKEMVLPSPVKKVYPEI